MSASPVLVLSADDLRRAPYRHAFRDLSSALPLVELWGAMGWFDITQRYSRSVIGPFWLTLSLAGFVAGLGLTYGTLFKVTLAEFLPYLTVGVVVWTFISTLIVDGCNVFVSAQVAIKQMPAPLSIHVYRILWRSLIILAHNAVIVLLVMLPRPWIALAGALPACLGMAIVTLNGCGFALLLGTLGARFRDMPPLMTNFTSLLFFVTPVFWKVDNLGERAWIATMNPAYHLIEIVRAPLVGQAVPPGTWAFVAVFTVLNLGAAFLLFGHFRRRIPYWL